MKTKQPELKKALQIIAGKKHREMRIAAERLGVAHITVRGWMTYGLPAQQATRVWNAAGKQVDLAKLVTESHYKTRKVGA